MDPPTKDATKVLSEFVARTGADDLPADLMPLAKLCLLDTIGAIALGSRQRGGIAVRDFVTGIGAGNAVSSVFGSSRRCTPPMAALANGMMGHAIELDDVHDESLTHPGVVVVPAAIASAEASGASGEALLCAIVLGYEMVGRAGLGVGATSHMLRGFYPTGTSGVFGSAAAAGKVIGLDSERMAYAFGIAASFASGIVEYAQSGGDVKWLHAGRASESGVTAAYLAEAGLTSPTTALEGRYGFCRTFSDAPQVDRLLAGLGKDYKIRSITVKPYACCSDIHPVIDATLELAARHSIDIDEIRGISVETTTKVVELNGIDGTSSIMAAKYSAPFSIGLALTRDMRDPAIYRDEILSDTRLADIQRKVRMRAVPRFDAIFPETIAARVEIEIANGVVVGVDNLGARGSIHRPLTAAEIRAKFRSATATVLASSRSERIIECIDAIDGAGSVHELAALMRCGADTEDAPRADPPGNVSEHAG